MNKYFWLRNVRSSDLLELFFVSAVGSVLLTRFFLQLTGYPQLGGRSLHIAHMLPGGLLMMAALIITFSFIGYRAKRAAAVIGGLGFGLFIDELGKFITRDNNYFFRPTVALLYLVFVLLFLAFRSLSRQRQLSQTEYLLNAISLMEEAVIHDLDPAERTRVLQYLKKSDPSDPLVKQLLATFKQIRPTASHHRTFSLAMRHNIEQRYRNFISTPNGIRAVDTLFVLMAVWSMFLIAVAVIDASGELLAGSLQVSLFNLLQAISTLVATTYVAMGVRQMRSSRLKAYELFMRGVLINIFVTQFFQFYRDEFAALPLFIFYLILYLLLRLGIAEERHTKLAATTEK